MRLGIVIFPGQDLQERANSYRKRYDPHYKLISPHLTLKEAFDAESNQVGAIVEHLKTIADQTSAFDLFINKVSHFQPTNNVIYFAVQESSELLDLYTNLQSSELLQHEKPYAFVPHITIGQKMMDDELKDVYARLRTEKMEYTVPVQQFHLVEQQEDKKWSIYQSFALKQNH
ncbi:2'-5' RNA ligase family protein [Bacillus horti]|uniref:Putative phosphoesterase J2S11_004103 n=1 Tax=Caldalkalibacillus horti TaxID=77523 RepID=A0ABT9W4I9_9BACI|nr:2'-5' RNA ligase family protein [Bacillus horti]MDQ0168151.1 2'-5' RNA ligase [Bacillus horti]